MALIGLRDFIKAISPKWLQTGVGEKVLYTIGLSFDALTDKWNQAMRMHIPTYGDTSALGYLAADRQLVQGPAEPLPNFATRLKYALDDWQHAGSSRALLRQLLGYVSPSAPLVRTVDNSSNWYTYIPGADSTQPPSHILPSPANWTWDSLSGAWWRFWVVIFSAGSYQWTSNEGTWGDGDTWGDTTKSWGLSVSANYVAGLRALVGTWKAAHAWCRWIVVSFDATLFDAAQPSGGLYNPDGTWGPWSKTNASNQRVPTRAANARYCDGIY